MKKSFLCIAPYSLYPANHGGSVFIWNKLKYLAPHFDIHVLSLEPGIPSDASVKARFHEAFQSHAFFAPPKPQTSRGETASFYRNTLLSSSLRQVHKLSASDLPALVEQYVRKHRIDFLMIEHFYTAMAFRSLREDPKSLAGKIPWLAVEHNVESNLLEDSLQFKTLSWPRRVALRREAAKTRRAENQAHRYIDGWLYISAADRKHFEDLGLPRSAALVTPVVKELAAKKTDFSGTGRIVFFGTLEFLPNLEGLLWFANHVWPIVLAGLPAARLIVAGELSAGLAKKLSQVPSLELSGDVSHRELDELIIDSDAFISPVRLGSGIMIKNIIAMNLAMPMVATSHALRGIPVKPGQHVLIADEPEAFAAAVLSLLQSEELRRRLSQEIHRLYENTYRPGQAVKSWLSAIDELLSSAPSLKNS